MTAEASSSLERCRQVMRDLDTPPAAAREAFENLTEADMAALGLRTFRMNYYAIYGSSRPPAELDRIAERALRLKLWLGWEHHAHLQRMGSTGAQPRMVGLESTAIEELRRRHGGIMIASFQFGAIRDIFADLALSGQSITFALARSVHDEYCRSRESNPTAAIWRHARVADAESVEGIAKLGRALDRSEIVLVCLDGNTGIGGAHDLTGRLEIDYLGKRAFVKTGAARIAAQHGKPIVPVLAPLTRRGPFLHRIGAPVDPASRLRGTAAKEFAAAATRTIYHRLERYVRHYPEQWGVVESFHRWRATDARVPPIDPPAIAGHLDRGGRVRVTPCSLVTTSGADGELLVTSVDTLRGIRMPSGLAGFLRELGDAGVDRARLADLSEGERRRSLGLVNALGALGCLTLDGDRDGATSIH